MSCRAGSLPSARRVRTTPVASTPFTQVSSRETSITAAGEIKTGVSCLVGMCVFQHGCGMRGRGEDVSSVGLCVHLLLVFFLWG